MLCKSRNFPGHPVIPSVKVFLAYFWGVQIPSGFVLKVWSFEYHDPTKNGSRMWGPGELWCFTDSKHCGLVLKPDLEDQKHPVDEKLKHEFRISIHSSMLGESASPQKNLRREATSSSDGFNHLLLVLPWACVSKFWLFSASTTARKINMEPENTLLHGNPKPWNLKVLHPQYMGYNP